MAKVTIPAGYGVTHYIVRRDRAQRAQLTLEYYNNGWVVDNTVDPVEQKNIDIERPLANASAFAARNLAFDLRIDGRWFWGDTPMGFPRIDVNQVANERFEFYCFTNAGDPNADVIAKILIAKA